MRTEATSIVVAGLFALFLGLVVAGCSDSGDSSSGSGVVTVTGQEGPSGSQAVNFLSSTTYTTLVVEVDYIQGAEPHSDALNLLHTRIAERCDKPGGISIVLDTAIPSPGVDPWTLAAIASLEQQHRSRFASGQTAVLYLLYLDGSWEGDTGTDKTLGLSYSGSSLAIFKDTIRGVSTGHTVQTIEQAVLVHELGHALGLVNNGIPMVTPHEDPQHPAHDDDSACVMYHAIESNKVAQIFGAVPDQFAAECIADAQAAGGR